MSNEERQGRESGVQYMWVTGATRRLDITGLEISALEIELKKQKYRIRGCRRALPQSKFGPRAVGAGEILSNAGRFSRKAQMKKGRSWLTETQRLVVS